MPNQPSDPCPLDSAQAVAAEVTNLVGALSHDLTAHLMVLESSIKRIRKSCGEDPLTELAQNFAQVDACLRESKRFLEDLRLLGRSGNVQVAPALLKLDAVVQSVVEAQASVLQERGLTVEIQSPLPTVWCNESRLQQVLTNLLRNAILHGCDRLTPRIAISATPAPARDPQASTRGGSPGWVWIRVHDNGPGIPVDQQELVFLPGKRLGNSSAPGTGLGLAIVAQTVEQLGGSVWIDAEAPGAAFVVSVPAANSVIADRAAPGLPNPHVFRAQPAPRRARGSSRRLSAPADGS